MRIKEPINILAEKIVLSKIIKDQLFLYKNLPFLNQEIFGYKPNKTIFSYIDDSLNNHLSEELSFKTLKERIKKEKENSFFDFESYLNSIERIDTDDFDIQKCIDELKDKEWKRTKIRHMNKMQELMTSLLFKTKNNHKT